LEEGLLVRELLELGLELLNALLEEGLLVRELLELGLLDKLLLLLEEHRFGDINVIGLVDVNFNVVRLRYRDLYRDGDSYLIGLRNGNLNLIRNIDPNFVRLGNLNFNGNGLLNDLFVSDGVGDGNINESFNYLTYRDRDLFVSGYLNLIGLRNTDLNLDFDRNGNLNDDFNGEGNLNGHVNKNFDGNGYVNGNLTRNINPNFDWNRDGNLVRSGDGDLDVLRSRVYFSDDFIRDGVGNLDVVW